MRKVWQRVRAWFSRKIAGRRLGSKCRRADESTPTKSKYTQRQAMRTAALVLTALVCTTAVSMAAMPDATDHPHVSAEAEEADTADEPDSPQPDDTGRLELQFVPDSRVLMSSRGIAIEAMWEETIQGRFNLRIDLCQWNKGF